MLKFNLNVLVIFIFLMLSSCGTTTKIAALKPEPDDATPLQYESVISYINLPITVKIKDIENQTNALLNGLIYEDKTIEDDDIEMKVWKLAPITIKNNLGGKGEKISTILPLKAIVKYRIGTKKMGIEMYDVREFHLDGVVNLVSDVALTNWKLTTKTELKSLDWNESPTMTVFGKNVPVTYLINPAIKLFKSKIERKIDEAIAKSMDFKPNVLTALEKICTPFLMNDTYESWLRIVPIEIYSTTAKLKNDTFLLEMGMKCNMETLIGKKPETKFNASKITLKTVTKIPEDLTANIVAISTYQEASKIMTKNFSGQEFGSGSKKVKVQNVAIWHKNGKMILALDLLGSINGTIYLSGFPKYNEQTKEIFFDQLSYALDTKNKLMRTANWLAQGIVLKKIEQNCRYSIKPNLEESQKNMMTYLKNYSPMQGVFINGKMEEIQFQKIQLTNQAIIAFIKINGSVNASINGLK
ncbi:protein of unknown function [Flavobacterium fryxellicola]|uniref:DUF4403 family protein n=1 Tax=Flavobacterium fryxellicola TaxID=249352 RepID=UPI000911FFDA|nr:DUF4403 family protein [Flavobacterium fryxellicola]SHN63885.1 protein of unknown function [Flavobacterium fryxellicola]